MRKNITLIAIFVALVIIFGYFVIFNTKDSNMAGELSSQQEQQTEEMDESEEMADGEELQGSESLEYIRLLNKDLECTISHETEESSFEGKYFTSQGKIRGDFQTDSPEMSGSVLSSMILDSDVMYVWSEIDGEQYGMKYDISAQAQSNVEANQPIALEDTVKFDCKNWRNVDESIFQPPADVLFQDFSQVINAGMEYGTVFEAGE